MGSRLVAALTALLVVACSDPGPGPATDPDIDPGADAGAPDATEPDAEDGDASDPDGDSAGPETESYPDPSFVHVASHPAVISASAPFSMDRAVRMADPVALPDLNVQALGVVEGVAGLWVGTASGLYRHDPVSDQYVLQPYPTAGFLGVRDISAGADQTGRLAVVYDGWLQWVSAQEPLPTAVDLGVTDISSVALGAESVWLGGPEGLHPWDGLVEPPVDGVPGPVRDVVVAADGAVWAATPQGVYRWSEGAAAQLSSMDAHALAAADGGVWAGGPDGVTWFGADGSEASVLAGVDERDCDAGGAGCTACLDCEEFSDAQACDTCGDGLCGKVESGSDCPADCGLPTGDVQALAAGPGQLVIGHAVGATVLHLDADGAPLRTDHYAGLRWLPGTAGQAVAWDAGTVHVGTEGGLSAITWQERRLDVDAAALEELIDQHFWRMDGFVASGASLDDPDVPMVWSLSDSDNDGLWTQMQVGAWCYAYAATGDEAYYDKARKALDTMFLLVDIPAVDFEAAGMARGFVARSLVRDDEGGVYESKTVQDNWHPVEWEGHTYYWKDDTSSDELAGHFFGYPLFHDLCAKDDAERAEISERAAAMMTYIVDAGFQLIDLDGQSTLHGHWEPERLAAAVGGLDACEAHYEWCAESWFGGGWLNSLEIMGHLLATYHMTGDTAFYDAYDALITEHRFDEVAMAHMQTATITCPSQMNHSDHELAMLAYHTIIRYEPNPERRGLWIDSLRYLMHWERVERNPLWAAFTALLVGEGEVDMAAALQSLRELPVIQQNWMVDNSHRRDALDWPDDRHDRPQFDRVFAYDEIRQVWWNGNFHTKQYGGDGRGVRGPMAWLLPYYALRYAGVITE